MLDDCLEDHTQACEHHWSLLVAEGLKGKGLNVGQEILEESVYVKECKVAFAADDGGGMLEEFAEERQQVLNEMLCEKVAEESESGHYGEGVFVLKVLEDGVIHEKTEFVSGLDKQRGEEVSHLFEVQIGGLAEVDGQYMRE